jgi:flavin reductase (DIM6/NTAB) family NADH-FMN oxidoreductase RutF
MKNTNLEQIDLSTSVNLSSPHPFALLVSKSDEVVNVMGISWFTFISLKPGKMVFSISKKSYTNELIKDYVSLCLPVEKIKKEAYECGTQTGRGINKAKQLGIELVYLKDYSTPVVAESSVAWILEVSSTLNVGDHTLYITDIKNIVGKLEKNNLYSFDGYKRLESINKR